MRAKLREIKVTLRRNRHRPIPVLGKWLGQVLKGYYAYHAVPTNMPTLSAFRHEVTILLWRTLRRRSQRDRTTWEKMGRIAADYLPCPQVLHAWSNQRFAVKHPRWEPYAGIPPVRICAGGVE
jgi:hypothetical protein